MWDGISEQVRKINDYTYISEKDYYKIKVGNVKCDDDKDNIDLPLEKKFKAVTISNRLLIEKDNRLFIEFYLEKCLYKDYWSEHNIKNGCRVIKNKKHILLFLE